MFRVIEDKAFKTRIKEFKSFWKAKEKNLEGVSLDGAKS